MAATDDKKADGIFGETTQSFRSSWEKRVNGENGDILVDEERIRELFNDLNLFPSKSQVYEMVHCAREGDKRGNFLTFGEFCVYATEMRRHYDQQEALAASGQESAAAPAAAAAIPPPSASGSDGEAVKRKCSYDVFLGGSCNPTTWRHDSAIPHFKSADISFYNPQQSNWVPEMIELEHQAKHTSKVLFFVVDASTRNVASMIEISYFAGKRDKVVVAVLGKYERDQRFGEDEPMSDGEFDELSSGVIVVNDLIERQGVPVFDGLEAGLKCASKCIREGVGLRDLVLADGVHPVKHADFQIGDTLVRLREAFDAVDTASSGRISVNDLNVAFRIHAHRDLKKMISDSKSVSLARDGTVDFDSFCCIMSEFKFKQNGGGSSGVSENDDNDDKLSGHEKLKRRRRVKDFFRAIFYRAKSEPPCQQRAGKKRQEQASGEASRRGSSIRDVYLGGAAWCTDAASNVLKKHGLTFFCPPKLGSRRRMPMCAAAMDNARVLLFVIPGNSRAVGAMNEAAFHIGQGGRHNAAVLCIQSIADDQPIDGAPLSKSALKDYNRGRAYLSDIANREGVPVFDNVSEALDCVVEKCKS